jgi:hypothetical protein
MAEVRRVEEKRRSGLTRRDVVDQSYFQKRICFLAKSRLDMSWAGPEERNSARFLLVYYLPNEGAPEPGWSRWSRDTRFRRWV